MCILVKSRQKSSSGKWQKRHIVASGGKGVITSGGKELRAEIFVLRCGCITS